MNAIRSIAAIMLLMAASTCGATEVRIRDLTNFDGARDNRLTGFGLVVGLNNTGGKAPITRRFAMNLLQSAAGIRIPPEVREAIRTDTREKTNNLSVVLVTATLPPFYRNGAKIDINVAAFDDASSLNGGILVSTPLFGDDNEVHAVATGPVSVDSFVAGGQAATVQKNHPTAGRVIGGAIVEKEVCTTLVKNGQVRLLLRQPDFETAAQMAEVINKQNPGRARAIDAGSVEIAVDNIPGTELTRFLSGIEELRVQPSVKAKVVINERTGTIVIGENVKISRAVITHSNLAIATKESPEVSQPAPFSQGETTVVPRTDVSAQEEDSVLHTLPETTTVGDLAQALNALGVPARDLIVIFQQLRDLGALHAELEFK